MNLDCFFPPDPGKKRTRNGKIIPREVHLREGYIEFRIGKRRMIEGIDDHVAAEVDRDEQWTAESGGGDTPVAPLPKSTCDTPEVEVSSVLKLQEPFR